MDLISIIFFKKKKVGFDILLFFLRNK